MSAGDAAPRGGFTMANANRTLDETPQSIRTDREFQLRNLARLAGMTPDQDITAQDQNGSRFNSTEGSQITVGFVSCLNVMSIWRQLADFFGEQPDSQDSKNVYFGHKSRLSASSSLAESFAEATYQPTLSDIHNSSMSPKGQYGSEQNTSFDSSQDFSAPKDEGRSHVFKTPPTSFPGKTSTGWFSDKAYRGAMLGLSDDSDALGGFIMDKLTGEDRIPQTVGPPTTTFGSPFDDECVETAPPLTHVRLVGTDLHRSPTPLPRGGSSNNSVLLASARLSKATEKVNYLDSAQQQNVQGNVAVNCDQAMPHQDNSLGSGYIQSILKQPGTITQAAMLGHHRHNSAGPIKSPNSRDFVQKDEGNMVCLSLEPIPAPWFNS